MNEDATAIKAIEELTAKALAPVKIGERIYVHEAIHRVDEPVFVPKDRRFKTLSSLVEYMNNNPDNVPSPKWFFHVDDFNKVLLVSPPKGEALIPVVHAIAESPVAMDFPFDKFLPVEDMTIKVRTLFAPTADLDKIVAMMVRVDSTQGITQNDDGVSQNLIMRSGVSGALKENGTNKGVFTLAPFRTFQEIAQPESMYLFRLKSNPESGATAAIFTAGGNAWRLDAIEKIKAWIKDHSAGKILILG